MKRHTASELALRSPAMRAKAGLVGEPAGAGLPQRPPVLPSSSMSLSPPTNPASSTWYNDSVLPGGGHVPYVTADHVQYDDDAPWPARPDGGGPSLERISPLAYGNEPANWASSQDGGTPGRLNSTHRSQQARYLPLLTRP
jgi:hypothetical protein